MWKKKQLHTARPRRVTARRMPARVVLVRHAQSTFNALHLIQGQLDLETPLDDVGLAQVARGAPACAALHRDCRAVYTSDLSRAAVTASAIARELGVDCVRDARLRERHLGVLQGLPRRELAAAAPEAHRAFKSRDADVEIPGGGESARSVDARLRAFFRDVATRHAGEKIIAVTHGGVLGRVFSGGRNEEEKCLCVVRRGVGNLAECIITVNEDGSWFCDYSTWASSRFLGDDEETLRADDVA